MDSDGFAGLRLTNTMTRTKEEFRPLDWADASIPDAEKRVRMYVCGPTVYDFAHIGNARPVIVFDVLFRLLRHLYGEDRVTYVRNITDVDDKINARAARDHPELPLNEAIRKVTEATASQFQKDAAALGCLEPTHQPRATEFVGHRADGKPDMVAMIATLIEKGHAYAAGGEVLFDVTSMPDYGRLSNRRLEDQQAGARVAVDAHKRNPGDFVLWKLSDDNEPGWESPFGQEAWTAAGRTGKPKGRPGWHIECSVMSEAYLGKVFDIHGGGLDLIFPHHENEIAQSRCAHGTSQMAQVWMHNGFLQLEGKKMSKSDGNFVTISELLETETFGGRKWPGEVLRLAMLMTDYREPIDFSYSRLLQAENILSKLKTFAGERINTRLNKNLWARFISALSSDLNTPKAIYILEEAAANEQQLNEYTIWKSLKILGFKQKKSKLRLLADSLSESSKLLSRLTLNDFEEAISSVSRTPFLKTGNLKADAIVMDAISKIGTLRNQYRDFFEQWESQSIALREIGFNFFISDEDKAIRRAVERRLSEIKHKNFAEADRIRDELLAQGIQLKDGKDSVTGERVTTWEVKR